MRKICYACLTYSLSNTPKIGKNMMRFSIIALNKP